MKARDIMNQAVVVVSEKTTVLEAVRLMKEKNSDILVVESKLPKRTYGILSITDILSKAGIGGFDLDEIRVDQIMTKPCITISSNLKVEYIAWLLVNSGIHHLPVVDDTLIGLVSIADVLHKSNLTEQPWLVLLQDEILIELGRVGNACCERGIMATECVAAWDLISRILCESAEE